MCPIKSEPPRRLKDYLIDDDSIPSSRRNSQISGDNHKLPLATLPRCQSRSRNAVESLQKLIRRSYHVITPSPAPATMRRTFSKRLMMIGFRWPEKKSKSKKGNKVKVKDILRWGSFRDLAEMEEDFQPLELAGVGVGPTSEMLPLRCDHGNCLENKRVSLDGEDLPDGTMDALDSTQVGPKDNIASDDQDDKEQHSPVSILDSPFRYETLESESVTSSFNQSLVNMERTKQRLLQSIQWFERLAGLDDDHSCLDDEDIKTVWSSEEEEEGKEQNGLVIINEECVKSRVRLSNGICWVQKGMNGLRDDKESVKDVERQMQWSNKFGEEKEELCVEIEVHLLHHLVDDLFVDFFACE